MTAGPNSLTSRRKSRKGFTLLELLVSLSLLVAAMTLVYSTFSTVLGAWQRGSTLLDHLHHGDFTLDRLVAALRSAAFFPEPPGRFGFHLESRPDGVYASDRLSWVSSGGALLPPGSYLAHGLHRIEVTAADHPDGGRGLAVFAAPHLADREETGAAEPWFVSSRVRGFRCRVWNSENETWDDRWEDTNSVPGLVEITLIMEPLEEGGDPVLLQRLVDIPLGAAVTQIVSFAQADAEAATAAARRRRVPPGGQTPSLRVRPPAERSR